MRVSQTFNPVNCLLLIPAAVFLLVMRYVDFVRIELAALGVVLLGVWLARNKLVWSARPPEWCKPLRRWSRMPLICCLLPAATSVTLRLMLLPWIPPPHPVVPDEYSHLLLAKTFLAGRLTNPPHPLWQHFESIHILSQPTYNSMYMAGQACFLALGKLLTGGFFGGVIISTALFCAALTWFLRMFVPPGWALFGGMIAAVRFGAASYWNNSYWGGSVAALGGALALGGWAGLMKNWKIGPALAFASGAVLLANTRPYEGFGFMAVLFISLVWRAFKQRARMRWSRVALSVAAASIVFSAAGWAMARHWRAVTGSALTLPYQVNQRTYGWPLTLPFTPVRQIAYRHPELARYRDFEIGEHEMITNPDKIPLGLLQKTASLWIFFFGPALSGALLFATQILSTPRLRVIWAAAGVVGLQALTEQSAYAHYVAPAAPVIMLFIVRGFQRLAQCRPLRIPWGPAMVRLAAPLMLLVIGIRAVALCPAWSPPAETTYISWCCTDARLRDREPLIQKLLEQPGKHLVLVSYDLKRYDTVEWVYNEPDIDHSRIVFARDMGPKENQELLKYYSDRRLWRVRIDAKAYVLNEGEEHSTVSINPCCGGARVISP